MYLQRGGTWTNELVDANIRSQDRQYMISSYSKLDLNSVMMCVLIFIDSWSSINLVILTGTPLVVGRIGV